MKAVARSDVEQGGAGDRIAELGGKVDRLDGRVDELGGRVDELGRGVDELGRRVDNGFNRIDARLESQGEAIARLEAQAENTAGELRRIDARQEATAESTAAEFTAVRKEMSEGFQRMQRLMIQVGGGIVITLLAASRFLG